ncbi:glycoside hydrolase family 66 protein [Paenibacillus beijingensis]|uniref:glycoside hydrolase family 66 protein n=1 Tax=Paenibacillus beijingensis TaxID=1126833 RepID=UPI002379790E|nr:glycoside hydrolase family 66 protein [Paenibacillus beijingensis]
MQFYDWQYKHHDPLKMDGDKPASEWTDIANRPVSFDTVKDYIELAHNRGMKAMNYNLIFGGNNDADQDGVSKEWGLYKDAGHAVQDSHPLPEGWKSLELYEPGNPDWQNYIISKEENTFKWLPFDGWHIDQLGSRGSFTYDGKPVNLALGYQSFIEKVKDKLDIDYVMNAVGQYGQPYIAKAPVKFLYSELWSAHSTFNSLKEVIDQNLSNSGNKLNTVLAAYMNYFLSNNEGIFNAPGVLLTDAVIFASDGSHLELGENMLSKEYLPHKNLKITPELETSLTHYYDFLVAYQNVLRDSVEDSDVKLESSQIQLSDSADKGGVWAIAKKKEGYEIVNFINLLDATTLGWNDTFGTQKEPAEKTNIDISVETETKVKA